MIRWLYTLILYLITPIIVLRLYIRARKAADYSQRIPERFGLFPTFDIDSAIWIHSVSVGETIAAAPLIKRLLNRHSGVPIVVTTMTPTGSERVKALFGDSVFHVYAPYDLPGAISRFLNKVRPKLLIIMETELWPNTIHYCHAGNIPIVLANARLSAKSASGYQRFSAMTQPMLSKLSNVVAQSQADADRFQNLGLTADQLDISGSIKFDIALSEDLKAQAQNLKSKWSDDGRRRIVLAASAHEGEDEKILNAYQQVLDNQRSADTLLVLVPRHPERFDRVAQLSNKMGFTTQRRSKTQSPDGSTQVYIGDTMGELLLFFGCVDIAFIGGSLVNNGGHNMLEAAAWGLPIITGQSDFNFADISEKLRKNGALRKITTDDDLAESLLELIESKSLRQKMGSNAQQVMSENRGALDRLMTTLDDYLIAEKE